MTNGAQSELSAARDQHRLEEPGLQFNGAVQQDPAQETPAIGRNPVGGTSPIDTEELAGELKLCRAAALHQTFGDCLRSR